jgi:hypothetical protein
MLERMSARRLLIVFAAWPLLVSACDAPPESGNTSPSPDAGIVVPQDAAGDQVTDSGSPDGITTSVPDSYSIVVLPDTQYYSSSWPDIFASQTRWIVDNRQAEQIAFVLHTGDITDVDIPAQWEPASQSLHTLDGEIPYVMTAGNHDYLNLADRIGLVNSYFPPSHFEQYPWFQGTFELGHVENSFSILQAGADKWLVLALEFGPRDEVLAWADNVLKAFHDTQAIIITHAYLYHDGTRYSAAATPHQGANPHDYLMTGQPESSINDGEEMWQKLIAPNSNVKLVFCGHDVSGMALPPGTAARLTSSRPDGTIVHQILANYQTCTAAPCETFAGGTVHGGNGFLRIIRFSPAAGTMSVQTYSPYVDMYLHDPSNEFTLTLN